MGRVPTGLREGERLLTSGLLRPWAPCTSSDVGGFPP